MTPKEKMAKAVGEPHSAPTELVESMVATVNAIEKGRTAEKGLKAFGDTAPTFESRDLAAVAAVGRLAQNNRLPAGTDAEALAEQLKALPAFEQLTDRSPLEVQHDLESGKFTDDLTRAADLGVAGVDLAAEPELDVPELDAPEARAPMM